MNKNINNEILENLDKIDIDSNKKMFIKEALNFEYDISNQSNPRFKKKYAELVNEFHK